MFSKLNPQVGTEERVGELRENCRVRKKGENSVGKGLGMELDWKGE